MSSSLSLTPTVTPLTTNQNEWKQMIMIGVFYSIAWIMVFIIWLCVNFRRNEKNRNDYSDSMDISQLPIENDGVYTDIPI